MKFMHSPAINAAHTYRLRWPGSMHFAGRPCELACRRRSAPIDEVARFLVGSATYRDGRPRCTIVDTGHSRELDLDVEVPPSELSAVCSVETWQEIYERLGQLINAHRSTLVFVNTRRLAERVSHYPRREVG